MKTILVIAMIAVAVSLGSCGLVHHSKPSEATVTPPLPPGIISVDKGQTCETLAARVTAIEKRLDAAKAGRKHGVKQ